MLGAAERVEEADLADLVRWAGFAAVGLLAVGPATVVALGAAPPYRLGMLGFLAAAFGPGLVASVAAGAGFLTLEGADRARAWPAALAVVLAVVLPLALLAVWTLLALPPPA